MPAVSSLLAIAFSLAPEVPADETEARRLDGIVVTAGRRAESAIRVAPATTTLGVEQIARQSPQTVADLLRGQVGAYVQQTTPGQGNVILRGLKGSEVLHLVDGVRLNNAFFRNAPNQYLALVDSQFLERVEVVRGPLSTLYGGDAMGGVIQFFTPEPRFDTANWDTRGQIRASLASADEGRMLHVRQAVGREGIGFSASLTRQQFGERRVGGGERLPFTGYSAEAASLRWVLDPSPMNQWLLGVDLSRQPRTPRHDALVSGFGQQQPENATFFFEPNQRRFFHLRQRWLASSVLWDSFEWHLARQVIDDDRRSRDFGSVVESTEQNRSTQDSFTAQLQRSFDGGLDLLYGMEWLSDTVDSARQRRAVDSSAAPQPATSRFPDGSRMRSQAAYAQVTVPLGDSTELSSGLRYSRYQVDLPAADRGVGVALDFDDFTGSLGLVRSLRPGLSLVGNVGRGFRAPNVFDLGTLGPRPGNRFNLPNPNLKPESLIGFDVGLKFDHGPWQGELFLFRSNYRDKITAVLTGGIDEAGRQLVQSRNAAQLDLQGVEAALRYDAESWSLAATLTHTRGEERLLQVFQPADRIPPLSGRLDFRWLFKPGLEASLALRYADRQDRLSSRDVLDPRINPQGTPGFAVLDFRLSWAASEDIDLGARIVNLADRRYREHGSGLDEAGRNLGLDLQWRF